MALSDFQDLVDDLVRDDSGKTTAADRDQAIDLAVNRYSKDRPRTIVEDLAAAAAGNALPLPAGWQADFSRIVSLEYPVDKVPPSLAPNDAWRLYQGPLSTIVQTDFALAAGEQARATYTVRHVVDGAQDTTPEGAREAIAAWAAALLLDQLASFFSGSVDTTIPSDSVDHLSKGEEYARRARAMRKRYFDDLGIDPKRNVAAGAVVDLDLDSSLGGDRLTHPRRRR